VHSFEDLFSSIKFAKSTWKHLLRKRIKSNARIQYLNILYLKHKSRNILWHLVSSSKICDHDTLSLISIFQKRSEKYIKVLVQIGSVQNGLNSILPRNILEFRVISDKIIYIFLKLSSLESFSSFGSSTFELQLMNSDLPSLKSGTLFLYEYLISDQVLDYPILLRICIFCSTNFYDIMRIQF
jgi:hypothetical protein